MEKTRDLVVRLDPYTGDGSRTDPARLEEALHLIEIAVDAWLDTSGCPVYDSTAQKIEQSFIFTAESVWSRIVKERFPECFEYPWNRHPTSSFEAITPPGWPQRGTHSVYYHWDNNDEASNILYVGRTMDFPRRMKEHRTGSPWWDEVSLITYKTFGSLQESSEAEKWAIQTLSPPRNRSHWGRTL